MSLINPIQKMSKSDPSPASRVLITDTAAEITKKIMRAMTDSLTNTVTYNPIERPGVSNLLEILSILQGDKRTPAQTAEDFDGVQHPLKLLKERTAEAIVREMGGVRERYLEYLEGKGGSWLDAIEEKGADKARASADTTMRLVKEAVGL